MVVVSWPYRGGIVAFHRPYGGRVVALWRPLYGHHTPYGGRFVAVWWPYLIYPFQSRITIKLKAKVEG